MPPTTSGPSISRHGRRNCERRSTSAPTRSAARSTLWRGAPSRRSTPERRDPGAIRRACARGARPLDGSGRARRRKVATTASEAVAAISFSGESIHETLTSRLTTFEETMASARRPGGRLVRKDRTAGSAVADPGRAGRRRRRLRGRPIGVHTGALGDRIATHVEAIDAVMSNRGGEFDQRMADFHGRIDETTRRHLDNFENASVGITRRSIWR